MAEITDGPVEELGFEEEQLRSVLEEIETPETDKFQDSLQTGWAISEFMGWMYEHKGLSLEEGEDFDQFQIRVSQLLFEYFDIDQDKVEEERSLMLMALNKRMEGAVMAPPGGIQVEMNVKGPDGSEETTVFDPAAEADTIIEPLRAKENDVQE